MVYRSQYQYPRHWRAFTLGHSLHIEVFMGTGHGPLSHTHLRKTPRMDYFYAISFGRVTRGAG